MSTNLILSVLLGVSMKRLWMLMNTIQILCNIPLLSIALPANALFTFQSLIEISKLNFIPKDTFDSILSHLGLPTGEGNSTGSFKTMGYSGNNLVKNMGLVFLALIAFLAIGLLILMTKWLANRSEW